MKSQLVGSIALCALLTNCASAPEQVGAPRWNTLTGSAPLIIAHRGASGYLPEHTLEAYMLAMEQGADVIEPDLVLTKDGVLIARHDRYLSTTTNVADIPAFATRKRANPDPNGDEREDWWVEDFTLAEITQLRARQPRENRPQEFNDRFTIPTFADILKMVTKYTERNGRSVGVYPETKSPGYSASIDLDFEKPLLAALEDFDAGPVFIQSFEADILKRLHGKTSAKLVQLVYEETPGVGPNISLASISTYADGVGPQKDLLSLSVTDSGSFLKEAHDKGLFVHPWTIRNDVPNEAFASDDRAYSVVDPDIREAINAPDIAIVEVARFFHAGVDGIFADFPDTAFKIRETMHEAVVAQP